MKKCWHIQSANCCLHRKLITLRFSFVLFTFLSAPVFADTFSTRGYIALESLIYAYIEYSVSNPTPFPDQTIPPNQSNIPDWVTAGIYCLGGGASKNSKTTDNENTESGNAHSRDSNTESGNTESGNTDQHPGSIAGNGDEGSEPPPSDEDDSLENAEHKLLAFDLLLSEFGALLEIAKKQNTFVVLETDLDGSLLQDPDDDPDFQSNVAQDIEQQRFYKFSLFLKRYSGTVVLVYNTARPVHHSVSTPDQKFREVGIQRTEHFPDSEEKGMIFESLRSDHLKTILPVPDYLISQIGSIIDSSPSLGTQTEMHSLNERIQHWRLQDSEDLHRLKGAFLADHEFYGAYYKGKSAMFVIPKENIIKYWANIEDKLGSLQTETPGFQATLTPLLNDENPELIDRCVGSLVSVNKGAAFRQLLNSMITKRQQNGMATIPLVFVFGDAGADMSMMRPDLEVQAMGSVKIQAISKRNKRYASVGIDIHDVSWWQQSVYPSNSLIATGRCGATVSSALEHPKLVMAQKWGITSFLESVVSNLRQRFIRAPDGDMPVQAGNF